MEFSTFWGVFSSDSNIAGNMAQLGDIYNQQGLTQDLLADSQGGQGFGSMNGGYDGSSTLGGIPDMSGAFQ